MKVLVIGASGRTGSKIVEQLLANNHKVVALVRDTTTFAVTDKNIILLKGDVQNESALEKACGGVDAVISALGSRSLGKSTLEQDFAKNIIAAMNKHGVSRLITLSAWGVGESRKQATLLMQAFFATLLRNTYVDKQKAEKNIEESNLNYTFVRPGRLMDDEGRKQVIATTAFKPMVTRFISRVDVARFMVAQLDSDAFSRKAPIIGYKL